MHGASLRLVSVCVLPGGYRWVRVLLCLWHLVLVSEPKLSGAIAMASGIELVLNPAETMGTSLF